MTRPSDHYPRRCGCGHHAADPLDTITLGPGRVVPLDEVIRQIVNDHPISLRDDLDGLVGELNALGLHLHDRRGKSGDDRGEVAVGGIQGVEHLRGDRQVFVKLGVVSADAPAAAQDETELDGHDDSSTNAARAGIPDAAPTVEADTPTRAGIGVEDATTPAPSTSDDYVSVSISLAGDRELVELVAALVIGGAS